MKRIALLLALVAVFTLSGVFIKTTQALDMRSGNDLTITDQELDHSLYLAGSNIKVNSKVKGDIYCLGSDVFIEGDVEGDVICAAQNITINGKVSGDLRIAAKSIYIDAVVGGNASLASFETFIRENAIINDVTGASSELLVQGKIKRDLLYTTGTAKIRGEIGRDAKISVSDLTIDSEASINGNLTYYSSKDAVVSNDAKIGTLTKKSPAEQQSKIDITKIISGWFSAFLSIGIVLAILMLLFDKQLKNAKNKVNRIWLAPLIGIAVTVIPPIAVILLFVVSMGTGVLAALILLVAWLLIALLAIPIAIYFFSTHYLSNRISNQFLAVLIGLLVIVTLGSLPYVGVLVYPFVFIFGMGIIYQALFSKQQQPVEDVSKKSKKQ